uniref:Uncharacterized protein n=1 Tax=Kalanchoe fedtschenkoi TaxID=63787 RepID=A0A7N0T4Z5_KALFE
MATKNSNNRMVPFAHIPIHMALKAAIELHVFDILAKSGPIGTQLTATQIASEIPTTNPKQAATSLHRILRFLSFHSFLTTSHPPGSLKEEDRLFGLTTLTAGSMVRNDGGALPSIGLSILINSEIEIVQAFDNLKDAVLDPDGAKYPFEMAHGEGFYDYLARRPDSRLNMFFNQLMGNSSRLFFNDVIRVYKGFEEVIELMDVGGNEGLALETIISLYPNIKNCINFDLPHVIARAPILKGVKHVARDMFETLPNSKTIILKNEV